MGQDVGGMAVHIGARVGALAGTGLADALIAACREEAGTHGAAWLGWQTAKDNLCAQRVYERVRAERSEWIDYGLAP